MTKARKHENTDGTSDIGDYVNSILDEHQLLQFSTINKAFSYLSVTLELSYPFEDECMHPLLKIDGCKCTRYTRTDEGPVYDHFMFKQVKGFNQINSKLCSILHRIG